MKSRIVKAAVILLFTAPAAHAGDYHREGDLICSDCHTQHYTDTGGSAGLEPGGPFGELLVASSTNVLCLFCHDGSDPDAPDVLSPVNMYAGSGDETSAAGFFGAPPGTPSAMGHDLSVALPIPLRQDGRIMSLTCASCHAVHGNEFYRNLRADPDSTRPLAPIRVGQDVFLGAHPQTPPERTATIEAYRSGNTGYAAAMRDWCTRCHDMVATDDPATPPAHALRHPGERAIGPIDAHADPAHWLSGNGEGFGALTGDGAEGVPRVRFQSPGASTYQQAKSVAATNQVFCGSCHLAHGGSYGHGLAWPYSDAVADNRSACQQCHGK